MDSFVYETLPSRVTFGFGTLAKAGEEIERLGAKRAFILATPNQEIEARALGDQLGSLAAGLFAGAVMHTPVDVTERALAMAREISADCTVALGGGSTIGLGKAIALRTDLPQIVIPTTYAGSEMTPLLGQTEKGVKTTLVTRKVLPESVIYDVDLTMSLPPGLSATSGLNAIAHAVEALYARDGSPVISLLAEDGIKRLAGALRQIVQNPADRMARKEALLGAWLCGCCLGSVGMALHHKLCHTLGGAFDLPHSDTHAIILPHALAYTAPAIPEAMAALRRALGVLEPAQGLFDLARLLGVKQSLSAIGMPEAGIDHAADLALANPYWNPRPIEREGIRALLKRAWAGERPT